MQTEEIFLENYIQISLLADPTDLIQKKISFSNLFSQIEIITTNKTKI